MALRMQTFLTEGIAQLSYLVGDDSSGTAAVIDPRPDTEVYLRAARSEKLAITHVFETHIHADFMSGARELAAATGGDMYLSREGAAEYEFEHKRLRDRQRFEFGSAVLTARHTPGHTPEHVSFLIAEKEHEDAPWGVFSGDSLFVNSAGRPDLLGDNAEELAEQLHQTLYGFYLKLDDHVTLMPGHGHGSPCGADIGDRLISTIGYERRLNPFLKFDPADSRKFVRHAIETAPPEPTYYKRMKKVNAAKREVLGRLPVVRPLPPRAFRAETRCAGNVLIDTRGMLAFGGGHIPNAINIGGRPELSVWAGWMLDPEAPILLVLDDESELERVIALFVRTGYTRFAGYLAGGMTAWVKAGLPLEELTQTSVHDLHNDSRGVTILDVRAPQEWSQGHIPGAMHRFLPELRKQIRGLNKRKPVATYCDSGYRASLAASLLQSRGFTDVRNVPGSWQAWTHAGYEIEKRKAGGSGK